MTYPFSEEILKLNPELAAMVGWSGELASKSGKGESISLRDGAGQSEAAFQRDVVIPWLHSQGWLLLILGLLAN